MPDRLAPALAGEAERADARRLLSVVPSWVTAVGFECRLGGNDRRVDVGVAAPTDLAMREWARAHASSTPWPESWRMLERYLEWWSRAGAAERNPFFHLELDGAGGPVEERVPSLFLGLDWPLDRADASDRGASRFSFLDSAVEALAGRSMEEAARALFSRCVHGLPEGGVVLHLGWMAGRSDAPLRLSVVLPRSSLDSFARRVGFTAWMDDVQEECATLAAVGGLVHLELDVATDPRPGLILSNLDRSAWHRLGAWARARGLVSAEAMAATLDWPGLQRSGNAWLRREISHVKLAGSARGRPRFKAYLTLRRAYPCTT